jgi:gamma-glutamylaminecyclotransferase
VRGREQITLFVYGTLRQGGPNHARLSGAIYLGRAATAPRFTLYDLGPYPALVAGGPDTVEGEVYEVGRALLRRLDRFEGHPTLYRRQGLPLGDGRLVEGYLWAGALPEGARALPGGRWRPGATVAR